MKKILALAILIGGSIEFAAAMDSAAATGDVGNTWFSFDPKPDPFGDSPIDLRFLNEKFAGEHGFIAAKDGHFVHSANGQPLRFWAVNGPSREGSDRAALRQTARLLAKYGVNLVRRHGAVFDKDGELNPAAVKRAIAIVEEMKTEGIYTHLSIYFPLWFTPRADHPWLEGYDGKTHPFAALMFNPRFQEKYRGWWKALLTTPSEITGKTLLDEPALFGLEVQNEDSFFFWTFDPKNIPDAQLRLLEKQFGDWLVKKHGSIEAAFAAWKGQKVNRDAPAEGRVSFRPLWNIFSEKSARDQDTAAFLLEVQTKFYQDTIAFLRQLGFKGLVTPSNWSTASPEVFGPLEKLSYTTGDFIDRHGYFECSLKGDNAAWSVRNGHTYSDRSALRFEAPDPTKPRQFVHPVMDPHYDRKPSMISETTFCRPNRYRSEAPLYFAAYGALQDTDSIVHFAFDSDRWAVKPGFWMQPWTLMSPAMMGQFPAAALIYRRSLVAAGQVLADIKLNKTDLLQLKGTPLPQDAALDELRLADVPRGAEVKPGQRIDPLIHYAGRVDVRFVNEPGATKVTDLAPFVDHAKKTVSSSTGELKLDYGNGVLTLNAARAQGLSGALKLAGMADLKDLSVSSDLELGHIIAVALDDQPLATSSRILLQVMSEEQETHHQTEAMSPTVKRIVNIGIDPWQVRELNGTVRFKRADAAQLKVTALDFNGYPTGPAGTAQEIKLQPTTIYYLIAASDEVSKPSSSTPAQTTPTQRREVKWNNPEGAKVSGLEHRSLASPAMGQEMGFNVWVPPAYATGNERSPVIYFLHGAGGNENSDAGGFSGLVRQAIEEGKMPPALCVFPNGGMSGYQDQPDRKVMMETFIIRELIPYIDANWRTIATRAGRALAGFSMGGGGAMRLAVKYPDTFSAAGSWAAAIASRRPGAAEELNAQLRQNADRIRDRVRLLLIVGDQDMTFAGHGPFVAQLNELKLAHAYQVLPGVGHDLGKYQRDTGARLVEFLGQGFQSTKAR